MLNRETIKFINDHYYVYEKTKTGFRFRKKIDWTWLIILGGFTSIISYLANIREPSKGFTICLLITLFIIVIIKAVKRRPLLVFDEVYDTLELKSSIYPIQSVTALKLESIFKAEYTASFKKTSKEYQITIKLDFEDQKNQILFTFRSDFREPNDAISELYDVLKNKLKDLKSIKFIEDIY
jgi:hypothetical protein